MKTIISRNKKETQNLGKELAKKIKKGNIFALYGDLGSGKTTFVQGIAEGLGLRKRILSPTFIILRSYKNGAKSRNFYHIDLYRIQSHGDITDLGIEELFRDEKNVIAIEWAEKIRKFLPKRRTDIYFSYLDENTRQIKIIENE